VRNLENFFHEIGMPTNIPELIGREATEEEIRTLVDKCSRGGTITIGAMEVLKADDMTAIYQMANRK
jgi:alcohol dehydrogenase YqhD (iron-dependent ADH family)